MILSLECKVNFVFVHQHNIESIFDPKIFFFHLTYFWVVNDRARNFKTFFKEYLKRNIICFNGFNFPQKMQFSKRYISLRVLISSEWWNTKVTSMFVCTYVHVENEFSKPLHRHLGMYFNYIGKPHWRRRMQVY